MKEKISDIVHDIRTPAVSIELGVSSLKEIMPKLVTAYLEAQKNNLNIPAINEKILNDIEKIVSNIEIEAKMINHYLDKLTQRSEENE